MAWTRKINGNSLNKLHQLWLVAATLCIVGLVFARLASASEPLWYLENPDEADVVPSFTGQQSPFPMEAAPFVAEPEPEPVFAEPEPEPGLSPQQQKAMRAAGLLGDIRKLLERETAFNPDVTRITVQAKVTGDNGRAVLIDDRWIKEGQALTVPVVAAERVFNMLSRLQALDSNLADIVEDEVHDQVRRAGEWQLTISKVQDGEVILTDQRGKEHVIYFASTDW